MEFLPVMQIYAKLLTQHSLTDIKEYDDLIKVQAPNSGEETKNAIEALWTAEENYENLLKKVNRVLNLQVPKTIRSVQVHCHQYFGVLLSNHVEVSSFKNIFENAKILISSYKISIFAFAKIDLE